MLDVRRLRLLRDLARLGTIAAVARANSYTASAVSQQLAALQRQAGVPLLERAGRRVSLTPAALALVGHAETILAALEGATAVLADARAGVRGTVRIGAFPSAVRTLLPSALVALADEHPALDLMITELDPAAMPEALRNRRLDVALVHDYDIAPAEPDLTIESVPLLEERVFLAVSEDAGAVGGDGEPLPADQALAAQALAARDGNPLPAAGDGNPLLAARDDDWIVGSRGTLCRTVAERACHVAGFTARVRHQVDDFAAVLALVAAGQGVALVPELGAPRPYPGVRLIPVPILRRTRVAFRRGAGAHPAVTACVAAIRDATACFLGR